jgi:tetratricopeptide (TPR) repeat protein
LGERHPSILLFRNNLADLLRKTSRTAEARRLYMDVLETRRKVLGEEHPDTLITMMSLGRLYRSEGELPQAIQLFTFSRDVRRRTLGETHPYTLNSIFELGRTYERQQRFADAEELYATLATLRGRLAGANHPTALTELVALGRVRVTLGKLVEGEAVLRDSLTRFETARPDAWQRFEAMELLGSILAAQKRYREAEPLLAKACDGLQQRLATIPAEDQSVVQRCRKSLSAVITTNGRRIATRMK